MSALPLPAGQVVITAKDTERAQEVARRRGELVPELVGLFRKLVGTPDDPGIGWRGHAGSTDVLFSCEYCGATHEDCTLIAHGCACPVPAAHAMLAKAEALS